MRSLVVAGLVASLLLTRTASADDGDRFDLATVGVQAGGGVAGLAVGGVALGLTGLAIGYGVAGKGNWGSPIAGGALGFVAGGFAGMVIGVQLSGDAREGTGRWWGTLAGAAVGTGGCVAVVIATESTRGLVATKAAGFILISLGMTIVGYHASADGSAPMAVPLTLRF